MLLETLLTATLETAIGLLAEVGFADELRDLKARLAKSNERKRQTAFDAAFAKAKSALPDDAVQALLNHRPFQEAIINGLLDPVTGFDVQVAAAEWIEKYPEWARPLRRFFDALDNALLEDSEWGPVLERFHQLRARREAQAALKERQLDLSPREITRQVFNTLSVGAGGIAAGGNVSQIVIQQLILQSGGSPNVADLRQRYLAGLLAYCRRLPLAAFGAQLEGQRPLTLDQVYIAINTDFQLPESLLAKIQSGELAHLPRDAQGEILARREKIQMEGGQSREEKMRLLPALEAYSVSPRMVLLGQPGAGKSTFAHELIALICEGRPPRHVPAGFLPLLIVLRDLAPRLEKIEMSKLSADQQAEALVNAVRDQVVADLPRCNAAEFAPGVLEALAEGPCVLVLDGLDEVPADLRLRVRQAVAALTERYPLERVLVTCRTRSYVGEAELPGFERYTLAPFDNEQITNFARAWYNAQATDAMEAERKAKSLAEAAQEPKTAELARNPMLLTVMAIIHAQDVTLPKERVKLYKRAVEILLDRWQKHKEGEEALAAIIDPRKMRPAMELLAYHAHRRKRAAPPAEAGDNGEMDLPRHLAEEALEDFLGEAGKARQFLNYVDQRAGLLMGRGGDITRPTAYTFPHRTFQEYLAGCYLLTDTGRDLFDVFFERAADGDLWNLPVQFAAEELLYNEERNGERTLLYLADSLLQADLTGEQAQRAALWSGRMAALASRDLITRDKRGAGGANYLQRLMPGLVSLLSSGLTPPERAEVGCALARLDDPRLEVLTVDAMQFYFVPAGPFWMGSNKEEIKDVEELLSESPRHQVKLPDYFIARYPVTNAQFAEFVEAGGYKEARYWREAQQAEIWREGIVYIDWSKKERDRPDDPGEPFNLSNHPVVGVTWYEALAFTRWLTKRWQDRLPSGWEVRLPTEAQWEKAARGGLQIPATNQIRVASPAPGFGAPVSRIELRPNANPIRRYTWEGEWELNRANTAEANIETTSAVGCFPAGVSPYNVAEMIGNVWEWCQSKLKKYPYKPDDGREVIDTSNDMRSMRGGMFLSEDARVALRFSLPLNSYGNIGLRVVVSPG
jgi:formylglycine-generating enzyme required for sulfatase activity